MTARMPRVTAGLLATVVVAGSLVLATTTVDAKGATAVAGTAQAHPGGSIHRITLVTGDVAELTTSPDGRVSARLANGEPYYFSKFDGDFSVVPASAYGLVAEGKLDRRLFDLTALVEQGYDDANSDQLPLLLTAPASLRSTPAAPQAVTVRRTLPSVGSTAVSVKKTDAKTFWNSISGSTTFKAGSQMSKVWLDGRTAATLDQSTQQIGAPTAWRAGYDGSGVKVAVLDTGYDSGHPDLAKQVVAAESFVPDQPVQDLHGHGTHTASIVAGLGTASDGKHKGVAPGSDLLIGKVLDNSGHGLDSEAIAGMEWAVQQGAKIISMSLGDRPSDGTDPMSQAVDRLSRSSGALFVIAAGNAGAEESVSAPGAASEALTVGAVDDGDKLANFSSRGPRVGDGAIKPDVTAPGVEIAAARAAGTAQGHLLDQYYTAMSGTSMATPHVAGAAAILAQRHPDWTGPQLKAALASTAIPVKGPTTAQQGLGRIDISRALDPEVVPNVASVLFGDLSWTGPAAPPPVVRKVAYHNNSDRPITLDLSVGAESPARIKAALTVSPTRLTIPAGGSAAAKLVLDVAKTGAAKYSGVITAHSGTTSYRTGVGFAAGGRLHQLTLRAIGRDGQPAGGDAGSSVRLWNQDTGAVDELGFGAAGSQTMAVPTGRYSVMALVMGVDETSTKNSIALLGDPDEWIDSDRTFTFDARVAHKVTVKTPRPAVAQQIGIAWHRSVGDRDAVSGFNYDERAANGIYVQDFGKVAKGTFQALQRWLLVQPRLTVDVSGMGSTFQLPILDEGSAWTPYVGDENLALVDAGDGTPAELARAKGKVALIRFQSQWQVTDQVQAARDAGAKAVFMDNGAPGFWYTGAEVGLPFYLLRAEQGRRLRDLLAKGPVSFHLSGVRSSTYRYDLAVGPSVVHGPLIYDFAKMRPAVVTTDFHRNDTFPQHADQRTAYLPGLSVGLDAISFLPGPVTRTDYLASDVNGVTWAEKRWAGFFNESGVESTVPRSYRPNEKASGGWWEPLMRPAVPEASGEEAQGWPPARFENALRIAIPPYVNGDRTAFGWSDNGDVTSLKLSSGGVELGRKDLSVAQFPVPAKAAWYDLTMDQTRNPDSWTKTSTATHTEWHFRSQPARQRSVLPLVQVDYQQANGWLRLNPAYQPGFRGRSTFRTTAEISYDGRTWQRLSLLPQGKHDAVTARIPAAPQGASAASIRVTATDQQGNKVSQTIEKAWAVR